VFSKINKDIPVFAPDGTRRVLCRKELVHKDIKLFGLDDLHKIECDFHVDSFQTPHDTEGSAGYIIFTAFHKIAFMTDLGEITPAVESATLGADTVFIEANYEPEMLWGGNYTPCLKKRIASRWGHLSNIDCAEYILKLVKNGAKEITLGHLSQENNTPETAFTRVTARLAQEGFRVNRDYKLSIAN
jgi:phosphoribosyl 1,2-cyclic phosphodiesterase